MGYVSGFPGLWLGVPLQRLLCDVKRCLFKLYVALNKVRPSKVQRA